MRRDVRAGDRRAASAAVSLEHVAVEPECPLPERLEVADAPKRAADQALDLHRAAVRAPTGDAALSSLAGRRGEHRVLGGHPPLPLAAEPAWDRLLDRGRAEDDRAPLRVQDRPVRLLEEVRLQVELAELVGPPAVVTRGAHAAALSGRRSVMCSTSRIGSWRNRLPISANAAGSPVVRKR